MISVGTGNSYGHPTASALTRLHAANVRTYWTETGSGVAPNATWDKVSNGQVVISATWAAAGVDTVRGTGFADIFTNSGTAADVTSPVVTVTNQNGGEVWLSGDTEPITWTAEDDVGVTAVDLAYSTDGGLTFPNVIASGLLNTGSYSWVVPITETTEARIQVTAHDAAGNTGEDASSADFEIHNPASAVAEGMLGVGEMLRLYPNPTSARAVHVLFRVPQATVVDVSIFDVTGRLVRRLESGYSANGLHDLRWDGLDRSGTPVSGGIYLVRVTSDLGMPVTKRLVLIR